MTEHAPLMLSIVLRCLCVLLATLGSTSCASRIWNEEIVKADPASDYVFANRLPGTNAQDVFIVLAFSGGGTRSAAFSYGILETLRDTEVTIDGRKRRLLDEVDVISRVEERRGSLGQAASPRFPSPLIEPDVRVSRIRLSDWLHRKAHGGRPM